MTYVSVVIPAYDEGDAIDAVLEQVSDVLRCADLEHEIIVVDDGSSDDTAEVARAFPGVQVWQHASNRGYGAALKTGIRHATGELIVITDADGTYPNERIPELVAAMDNADMVVGARTRGHPRVPLVRRPAKWFLRKLAEYVSETRIPDLNSGLRAFRRADVLHYLSSLPNKFSFTTTITLITLADGGIIEYVPIEYYERLGRSKIRPVDAFHFLILTLRAALLIDPLKVFLPAGLGLTVAGFAMGVYQWAITRGIAQAPILLFLSGLQITAMGLLADLIVTLRRRD
jgi:glycosyltransferase involved in cell wall biosynthesis